MAVRKALVQADESPVGKVFVVGNPNAKGEFVIVLGGTRWQIANPQCIQAGERVKVTRQDEELLEVVRA